MDQKQKQFLIEKEITSSPLSQAIPRSSNSAFLNYFSISSNLGRIYCFLMILTLFGIRNSMILSDIWTPFDEGEILEALAVGNFAYDILDGVWRGWHFYLGFTTAHTGWALIPSLIATPLYTLFGNSLLVLSQVPILYSITIIYMMYRLCSKYFDGTVAVFATTFYVFLPLRIQEFAVYPYSFHLEHAFYTLLGLTLFLEIVTSNSSNPERKTRQNIMSVLFGVVSGIGVFNTEVYLLMLAAIFCNWSLYCVKGFSCRNLPIIFFILGFLIGLIPYFIFSPLLSLDAIKEWIVIHWQTTHSSMSVLEYSGLFGIKGYGAIVSLFWQLHYLSLMKLSGIALLLLGVICMLNPQRHFRYKGADVEGTLCLNIIRTYTLTYLGFVLSSAFEFEAYSYFIVANLCILFAISSRDLLQVAKRIGKPVFQPLVVLIVMIMCGYNFYSIMKNVSPWTWQSNLKLQLLRKGTGVSDFNRYHYPAGFKTPLTLRVEKESLRVRIVRANPEKLQWETINFDNNGKKDTIDSPYLYNNQNRLIRLKPVFIDSGYLKFIRLDKLKGAWAYGGDIAFTGLETLARRILWFGHSDQIKEIAIMSLAVHYNSDHWMSFLFEQYENKDMEKVIPKQYRKYFYQEFGRRLRSQYNDREKATKALRKLSTKQKAEIMAGYDMANIYVEAKPYDRKDKWGRP